MANLSSIPSSVTFAVTKGNQVHSQLSELINIVHIVPSDIRNLQQEVWELCPILGELENTLGSSEHRDELSADLKTVIGNCTHCFSELESLVQNYWVKKGDGKLLQRLKSLRWALQEKQVAVLMKQLEVQRAALSAILKMSVDAQGVSVKDIRDLARKKENNFTLLEYVSIPTFHLLDRTQENGDIAPAYGSIPRGPIPNSSSKDISSRDHGAGASDRPRKPVAHVTETSLPRSFSPRPQSVNYGSMASMRRGKRAVCRHSAKVTGSMYWI